MRKPGVNKELQAQIAVFHTVVPLANGLQLRSLVVVLRYRNLLYMQHFFGTSEFSDLKLVEICARGYFFTTVCFAIPSH